MQLQGVGPVADLHARFTNRLNVLTGDNGLGKSFLLDVAWWALTGTWPGARSFCQSGLQEATDQVPCQRKSKTPEAKAVPFDPPSQSWVRPAAVPTIPGLVIYGGWMAAFQSGTPHGTTGEMPSTGEVEAHDHPRSYDFTPDSSGLGLYRRATGFSATDLSKIGCTGRTNRRMP